MLSKLVADIDKEQMPRERMANLGVEALSDMELMAVLLRTGYKNKSVFELARELTANGRIYRELVRMRTVQELKTIKGLGGPGKSSLLLAALELGRRIAKYQIQHGENESISCPKDVYDLLAPELRFENVEHFYIVFLNNRSRLLTYREITKGTLTSSLVHQREVFKAALLFNAAKIIAVHNHPSGDPSPSRDDKNVTRILREAGDLMGISLVDHIIIGNGEYYSFSDNGLL